MSDSPMEQKSEPQADGPGLPPLKDNNQLAIDERQLSPNALALLRHFSGMSLRDMKASNAASTEGLVIIGEITEIEEKKAIFELLEAPDKNDPDEPGTVIKQYIIQTHNIMGVFTLHHGDESLRLQITSRFDNSEMQPFLCWMLERVLKITFSELIETRKASTFWTILLELLFWRKLGEASSIGLYRQYQRIEYNDLRFRGRLDIDRHIRLNMPLWDKIAYSRREITYDNPINHLLRHAAKMVLGHWGDNILVGQENKDSLDMFSAIETNTSTWELGNLRDILLDKEVLNGIRHPYYADVYEDLRLLALAIVLEHGVDLYARSDPDDFSINGILFDGAWLWEEYLSTILVEDGFMRAIPMDTNQIYALKSGSKPYRKLFPDFRLPAGNEDNQNASIVLDAKYKRGDRNNGLEVKREDMHQCFCYMLLTGAAAGGVIYPPFLENEQIEDDCNDEQMLDVFCPDGPRSWRCFTFGSVDKCTDETFADRMRENENLLRQFVLDMKNQAKMNDSKRKASAQQSRNGTKA